MPDRLQSTDFDPFEEPPPCVRCEGERCLPECEYGLGNWVCPREAEADDAE